MSEGQASYTADTTRNLTDEQIAAFLEEYDGAGHTAYARGKYYAKKFCLFYPDASDSDLIAAIQLSLTLSKYDVKARRNHTRGWLDTWQLSTGHAVEMPLEDALEVYRPQQATRGAKPKPKQRDLSPLALPQSKQPATTIPIANIAKGLFDALLLDGQKMNNLAKTFNAMLAGNTFLRPDGTRYQITRVMAGERELLMHVVEVSKASGDV